MSKPKRITPKAENTPVRIEGTEAIDGSLWLKRPTLRFTEKMVRAQASEANEMPIADTVLWAFQDGAICDKDGQPFDGVDTLEDVDEILDSGEAVVVFTAIMKLFQEQFAGPKSPAKKSATRKR